ncbi:MAG: glucose-6-phosphate dehydrogenase [Myxococcales bacterium]|nr:MAG: glucose-6-phosphate dehydrogenase [Myxococcales bacterium]
MEPSDACTIVVFGATGDLAAKKIFPALAQLTGQDGSDTRFDVVGVGRTKQEEKAFRAKVQGWLEALKEKIPAKRIASFLERVGYVQGDPSKPETHRAIAERLDALVADGASPNRLFYAATPAEVFPEILRQLAASHLLDETRGWSRLVIEKPFGLDLASARELNALIGTSAKESQIFRIDHFIGKSTVQNILFLRFANRLFEPVWDSRSIDWVEITAAETLGVGTRAGFYDATGALRDMVQNHLMQLLCVTAMEVPAGASPEELRDRKVELLRAVRPIAPADVAAHTARGRYTAGQSEGKAVNGYTEEEGVKDGSTTETFAAVQLFVDNDRWRDVPFYLRSGKRLASKLTELRLHLKPASTPLFGETGRPNTLTVRIAPDEGITVCFSAKRPDSETETEIVSLDFSYARQFDAVAPDSYESLLVDVMRGQPHLFTRHDEAELAWGIITPILEGWKGASAPPLESYEAGSEGPAGAAALLSRDGHAWRHLVRPADKK